VRVCQRRRSEHSILVRTTALAAMSIQPDDNLMSNIAQYPVVCVINIIAHIVEIKLCLVGVSFLFYSMVSGARQRMFEKHSVRIIPTFLNTPFFPAFNDGQKH